MLLIIVYWKQINENRNDRFFNTKQYAPVYKKYILLGIFIMLVLVGFGDGSSMGSVSFLTLEQLDYSSNWLLSDLGKWNSIVGFLTTRIIYAVAPGAGFFFGVLVILSIIYGKKNKY